MTVRVLVPIAMLVVGAAVPPASGDADLLRTALTLAAEDYGHPLCVVRTLDEPPFAGLRRDLAEHSAAEGSAQPDAAARRILFTALNDRWTRPDRTALDPADLAGIIASAAELAERGDPRPLLLPPTANLNVSDPGDEPQVTAAADPADPAPAPDAIAPPSYGAVARGWLARGQVLERGEDGCGYPFVRLSSVAREGRWAFVDVGLQGTSLGGAGATWAFRRERDGWARVAVRRTWVS